MAGVLGGLVLLVVAVLVVFAFGRHNPSPPSLRKEPNDTIPGEILYFNRESCFVRATASGRSERTLACVPRFYGPRLYWIEENTAGVIQYGPSGGTLYEVDLATGAQTSTGRQIPDSEVEKGGPLGIYGGAYAPDGTYAYFDEDGGFYQLKDGVRTKVGEFDLPKYNTPQVVLWSPDSQWVLVQYYPRRGPGPELWVVSRDGRTRGTLTRNSSGGGAAWRIPGMGTQPALP